MAYINNKPFTLTGVKQALRAALEEKALTVEEVSTFATALSDAAMALEIGADEMRIGSPLLTRRRASTLGDLGLALEEVADAASKGSSYPLDPAKKYVVGDLDMYGLSGRERHPQPKHKGKPAQLLRMVEEIMPEMGMTDGFQIWLCLVGEGRDADLFELADYELEEVQ